MRHLERVEFRFSNGTSELHRDTIYVKSGKATLSTPTFPGAVSVLVLWWLTSDSDNPIEQQEPSCQ